MVAEERMNGDDAQVEHAAQLDRTTTFGTSQPLEKFPKGWAGNREAHRIDNCRHFDPSECKISLRVVDVARLRWVFRELD
jgi:hypothetical protein